LLKTWFTEGSQRDMSGTGTLHVIFNIKTSFLTKTPEVR
jgi:hypothetical protein